MPTPHNISTTSHTLYTNLPHSLILPNTFNPYHSPTHHNPAGAEESDTGGRSDSPGWAPRQHRVTAIGGGEVVHFVGLGDREWVAIDMDLWRELSV